MSQKKKIREKFSLFEIYIFFFPCTNSTDFIFPTGSRSLIYILTDISAKYGLIKEAGENSLRFRMPGFDQGQHLFPQVERIEWLHDISVHPGDLR